MKGLIMKYSKQTLVCTNLFILKSLFMAMSKASVRNHHTNTVELGLGCWEWGAIKGDKRFGNLWSWLIHHTTHS